MTGGFEIQASNTRNAIEFHPKEGRQGTEKLLN